MVHVLKVRAAATCGSICPFPSSAVALPLGAVPAHAEATDIRSSTARRAEEDAARRRPRRLPRRREQRSRRIRPFSAKHGEQRRQLERALVQWHASRRPPTGARNAGRPARAHRQCGVRMRRHGRRVLSAGRVAPALRHAPHDPALSERRVQSYVDTKACMAGQCRPGGLVC